MNLYRIIDANINRVSEGIRVLEDISRFILEDTYTTNSLRELRHDVRKTFSSPNLIRNRNSSTDIGKSISFNNKLDNKETINDLISSNFKRIQEGLRSIEECLKVLGYYKESKIYESYRFKSYTLEKNINKIKIILNTDIYVITGEEFSLGRKNIEVVKELIDAGIKVIQYREKKKSKIEKYNECLEIRKLTREKGVTFIVNDDVDIAVSVNADGIHLGQDDMPIEEVRKIVGNMIIGISTHNREQVKDALEKKADYIGVGPIYHTKTKENLEECEGLKFLKWVSENVNIPYVAIGGIKESNINEVKENGGKCFAMISEIVGSENIYEKINSIRNKL